MSKELCNMIERQTITHRCGYLAVMKRFLERYKGPKIVAGSRPLSFGRCDADKTGISPNRSSNSKVCSEKRNSKATVGDHSTRTFDL